MIPQLTHLRVQGVRGLCDKEVRLPRGRPFFITGPAASGKSCLLQAIVAAKEACGGYGPTPNAKAVFSSPETGEIALLWRDALAKPETPAMPAVWRAGDPRAAKQTPAALATALAAYDRARSSWKLEHFDADRRLEDTTYPEGVPLPLSGLDRVTSVASKYAFVRSHLVQQGISQAAKIAQSLRNQGVLLSAEEPAPLADFARILRLLSDKLTWVGLRSDGTRTHCELARRRGTGHQTVELSELSHSERMLVLFAAAIDALGLDRSLLLVDTPELAMHPEDQLRLVEGLRAAAPEGQLIFATTSPAILRSAAQDQVVVLEPA